MNINVYKFLSSLSNFVDTLFSVYPYIPLTPNNHSNHGNLLITIQTMEKFRPSVSPDFMDPPLSYTVKKRGRAKIFIYFVMESAGKEQQKANFSIYCAHPTY